MKRALLSQLAFAAILIAATASHSAEPQSGQPNIIFILADDLGYGDLSCLGQQYFQTPNIDKLKTQGMLFTEHYSGSTVCAPARCSLMTGLHTGHAFIRGNKNRDYKGPIETRPEGQSPVPADSNFFSTALQKADYATGVFGKWGLGYPGSEGDPLNQGFDVFFGYNSHSLAHNYYPSHLWDNDQKLMLEDNADANTGTYAPLLIHDRTLEFIEDNKDGPFFCFVASIIPHAELVAPEKYMDKMRGAIPETKPYKGTDSGPRFRKGPYQSQAEPHTAFAAMIKLLDDQVGEIIAKTEALGIADNTLILFASDNGAHLEGGADPEFFNSNGPFRGFKRDLYDGGIHVPLIAYWPGKIKPNSESDHISAFWDFAPTIREIAGLPQSEETDGISFLPTLLGTKPQPKHDHLYWEFTRSYGRIAVRMGKWKGVIYNASREPTPAMELYNLSEDRGEAQNLASQYPEIVKRISQIMKAEHTTSEHFPFRK